MEPNKSKSKIISALQWTAYVVMLVFIVVLFVTFIIYIFFPDSNIAQNAGSAIAVIGLIIGLFSAVLGVISINQARYSEKATISISEKLTEASNNIEKSKQTTDTILKSLEDSQKTTTEIFYNLNNSIQQVNESKKITEEISLKLQSSMDKANQNEKSIEEILAGLKKLRDTQLKIQFELHEFKTSFVVSKSLPEEGEWPKDPIDE